MRKLITTGWTWTRAAYLLIGLFLAVQTFLEGEWPGILLGSLLALMGLLGLGCAGNCSGSSCATGGLSNEDKRHHKLQ